MLSKFRPGKVGRRVARVSAAGTLSLALLIPLATLRPVDRADWSTGNRADQAVKIAESIRAELSDLKESPLSAGWAALPLSVYPGMPLAGYGAREGAPSTGTENELFARALYLKNETSEVTVLSADILLVHAGVAEKVMEFCPRAGISPDTIYFTATHTHCGPGGWGPNLIEESVCGEYDRTIVISLARDLIRTILAAKESARTAEWAWLKTEAPEFLRNRTVKGGIVDPVLDAVAVRYKDTGEIGIFAFFGAHATCLGPEQMSFHGDYPGFFVGELENDPGIAFAAFGSASVGSQSPVGEGQKEQRARSIGTGLAQKLRPLLDQADWQDTITLGSARKTIPLPDFQIRLTGNIRVSDWLADNLHADTAPIHFVHLGTHRLVGLPVEYSALLSAPLRKKAKLHGIDITPTAFNGDYIGYVLPPEIYDNGSYETRMNFLGPGGGAYFTRLIEVGLGIDKSSVNP